jgi:hypothetical protein
VIKLGPLAQKEFLMTWEDLIGAEPRLIDLEADVLFEEPGVDGYYCANHVWYRQGGFKGRYLRLVGLARNSPPGPPPPPHQAGSARAVQLISAADIKADRSIKARRRADEAAGIGWLWSGEAYDVGYHHLYDLLPDCCHCACPRLP